MLELTRHGQEVVADWWLTADATDQNPVAEVLDDIACKRQWWLQWHSRRAVDEPDNVWLVSPRDGLTLIVDLWPGTPDAFDVRSIYDVKRGDQSLTD